jgi:hypothetical protein
MRLPLLTLAALLLAPLPGRAGGTAVSASVVPVPAVCGSGGACTNSQLGPCATDAACDAGTLAPSSKFSYSGKKLLVKATFRGVIDGVGMPVTTDGTLGTNDDYIVHMHITTCDWIDNVLCTPENILAFGYPLKLELKNGKGKLKVDLSGLPNPAGTPLNVRGADLRLPPTNPAMCQGDNSTAGIGSRTVANCTTGALVGMTGVLSQQ